MPTITYSAINRVIKSPEIKETLLDISIKHRIPHIRECGGQGKCTTCRIKVHQGQENLSKPTPVERRMAYQRHWEPSIRLACQCVVQGDVTIQRLLWTGAEISQIQLETLERGKAEEKELVILIGDLRNFTEITAAHLRYDMAHMLNRFYTVLSDPIIMNDGIIYQYIGDEIVGIFGLTGGTKEENCMKALRAAKGMQFALERLNYMELKDFQTTFELGIGINTGPVFVGHLGHPNHQQLAIVGDAINIASRIQDQTKETGSKILMSHEVYRSLNRHHIELGNWYKKKLKGKEKPVFLYQFIGFKEMDMQEELQASLGHLLRNEGEFATLFYQRLFEVAPSVRALFKSDMTSQGRALTHMLVGIVYALSRPSYLSLSLTKLGENHAQYGVRAKHYPIVLQVLNETIHYLLGDQFPERTKKAWKDALVIVTDQMKNWKNSITMESNN